MTTSIETAKAQLTFPNISRAYLHVMQQLNGSVDVALGLKAPIAFKDLSISASDFLDVVRTYTPVEATSPHVVPVNLSDFDGTITSGRSGSYIFEYGAKSDFFLPVVRPKLDQMLAEFSLPIDETLTPGQDFLRILQTFRESSHHAQLTPAAQQERTTKVYEMLSWIYAGHTREEVHAFARKAFAEIGYESMHFEGAKEIIAALKEKGIETLLISVKFQPILEIAGEFFGVPHANVAGMNLQSDEQGRFTTEIKPPVTFREGKVQAAKALIDRFNQGKDPSARPLLAMGDSPSKSDQQLLDMAQIAVVVEPQTPKDAEYARASIRSGRRSFILDYEATRDGVSANTFDRNLEVQAAPQGKFL